MSAAQHPDPGSAKATVNEPHRLCVAPMMDWTDRHQRFFMRLLTPNARLYTEMVTTGAILHGDRQRFLAFDAAEHPVALQLGGSDPVALAEAAAAGAACGYDEINLNCGCPSDRVQSGHFGACLMAEPQTVAKGVAAMRAAVSVPVTIKCRIGIDEVEPEPFLMRFIETIADAGCETIIVHARKAWLKGLSPKENRTIPPLDYELVARMGTALPEQRIILNGGIADLATLEREAARFDGVMIGREAYQNPYFMAEADHLLFGTAPLPDRADIIAAMAAYATRQIAEGVPLKSITRHMMGLYNGLPGARRYRRVLSEKAPRSNDPAILFEAAEAAEQHKAAA